MTTLGITIGVCAVTMSFSVGFLLGVLTGKKIMQPLVNDLKEYRDYWHKMYCDLANALKTKDQDLK